MVASIACVPLGPVVVATLIWRRAGKLHLTVICKAAFSFVQRGTMRVAAAPVLHRAEAHFGDSPARTIRAPADMVPFRPLADVFFTGHAHAPRGEPAPRFSVRLGVVQGRTTLLDKLLEVVGPRTRQAPDPAPIVKMPLVYEHAYGGVGVADNPFGTGAPEGADAALPNVVLPGAPATEPAGYAPLSAHIEARKKLLRGARPPRSNAPVMEIPDDLDGAYFQFAPTDQRIESLRGDEWVLLSNMHPAHELVQTQLPGALAAAWLYSADGSVTTVPLRPDTLHIDGDAEQCVVTWRGALPVGSEEALRGARVAAGLEWPGQPLSRPAATALEQAISARAEAASPARGEPPPSPAAPMKGTVALEPETQEEAARAAATPFGQPMPRDNAPVAAIPGAPWSREAPAPRPVRPRAALTGTLADDASPPAPSPLKETRFLDDSLAGAGAGVAALPFAQSAPVVLPAREVPANAPLPGAPWSEPARPVPRRAGHLQSGTLVDADLPDIAPLTASEPAGSPAEPAPAPAAATAPPAPDIESAPAPAKERSEAYGQNAPWARGAAPAVAPAGKPREPRPALKGAVYDTFRKRR